MTAGRLALCENCKKPISVIQDTHDKYKGKRYRGYNTYRVTDCCNSDYLVPNSDNQYYTLYGAPTGIYLDEKGLN